MDSATSFLFNLGSKVAWGILAGMAGLVMFFGRMWFRSERKAQDERDEQMRNAISSLADSIKDLNRTLGSIKEVQTRHDERLERVRQDVDDLQESMCSNQQCPHRQNIHA